METLPPEMLLEVCQYLTLRDLASCIAVSRSWREAFNTDSLWQHHCDPSLAEPLENTPCVVEPRFVSPEVDNSTLTPISYWRMAFLREHHLWKNYKQRNHKRHGLQELDIGREFLSNTLLVRHFKNRIEIWDVSTVPASIIASVNVEGIYYCKAYRTNRLVVCHEDSVTVFHVDYSENSVIEFVHNILVESYQPTTYCVNGSTYIHVNDNRLTMDVIDLEKGMKIKTEQCPVMRKGKKKATIIGIKSSTNSDYVIIMVKVPWSCTKHHCYIYSPGQLVFASGPIFITDDPMNLSLYVINRDYLACSDSDSLKIFNCFSLELVSERSTHSKVHPHVFNHYGHPRVFNDNFICKVWNRTLKYYFIERFSLTSKTWTPVIHPPFSNDFSFRVINNKFITCAFGVWVASGRTLKPSDIPEIYCNVINESFTRGVDRLSVYYYW